MNQPLPKWGSGAPTPADGASTASPTSAERLVLLRIPDCSALGEASAAKGVAGLFSADTWSSLLHDFTEELTRPWRKPRTLLAGALAVALLAAVAVLWATTHRHGSSHAGSQKRQEIIDAPTAEANVPYVARARTSAASASSASVLEDAPQYSPEQELNRPQGNRGGAVDGPLLPASRAVSRRNRTKAAGRRTRPPGHTTFASPGAVLMSNLNKAFIKAFDKSRASAVPQPHAKVAPVPVATAPVTTVAVARQSAEVPAPPINLHSATPTTTAAAEAPPIVRAESRVDLPPPVTPAAPVSTPWAAASQHSATQPSVSQSSATQPSALQPPAPPKSVDPPVVDVVSSSSPPSVVPMTVYDAAHIGPRPPHANFAEPRTPLGDALSSGAARRSPTVELPLLAPPPVILAMPTSPTGLHPVFEVTHFEWPSLTEQILSAAAAQFRSAANDLIDAGRRHRKVVAVTAARRGEGCTSVALALARALAEQQQHVILVDAHFDAPALAENLGLAPQVGWEDALSGDKPLAEALVESLDDHLTVLPMRQAAADEWRVGTARLKSALDELRRNCDLVLIDAGPLGTADDRRHLLSWAVPCRVDRALIVRDLRTATEKETTELDDRLHGCGIAQWHFVENFAVAEQLTEPLRP